MDKIILGILMLRRMTAYEIRNVIRNNFKSICSDSLGSIQTALKKLLGLDMVTCQEVVENGVNKKRFAITDKGQQTLTDWLMVPLDTSKTKNMDFGKLLFMGFLPKEEQEKLLDKIILSLEEEYQSLKQVKEMIDVQAERKTHEDYLQTDPEYQTRIASLDKTSSLAHNIEEISTFTLATLDYGIDVAAFNVDWFKKLRKRI